MMGQETRTVETVRTKIEKKQKQRKGRSSTNERDLGFRAEEMTVLVVIDKMKETEERSWDDGKKLFGGCLRWLPSPPNLISGGAASDCVVRPCVGVVLECEAVIAGTVRQETT